MNDTGSRTSVNGPRRLTTVFCLDTRVVSGFYGYCRTSGKFCRLIILALALKTHSFPLSLPHQRRRCTLEHTCIRFRDVSASRLFVRVLDLTRTFTGTGFRSAPQDASSKVPDIILTLQDVWRLEGWGSTDVPGYLMCMTRARNITAGTRIVV